MASLPRRLAQPVALLAVLTAALVSSACTSIPPASTASIDSTPAVSPTDSGGGGGQSAAAEPTPGTSLTACELVSAADVEAVLSLEAGTVAAGTLEAAGTVLDPGVTTCTYEDQSWGGLIVSVTPTDGVNAWDALATVYTGPAESLNVGDAGLWFEDYDRGYFLKGSAFVELQFTFLVDGTPFRDPTIALGQVAVDRI